MASTRERDDAVATTRVEVADGDDIVVIPEGSEPLHHRRRVLLVAAVAAVAIALSAVIAVAVNRDDDDGAVRSSANTPPPAQQPAPSDDPVAAKPKAPSNSTPANKGSAPTNSAPARTAAPAPQLPVGIQPPPSQPAVQHPPPAPKDYPLSSLQWSAPASLSIKTGTTKPITVTVTNPTDGNINLPYPLSCGPQLGEGVVCPAVVQIIGAGESASATYTIDARDIEPGRYTLRVLGVRAIAVTVTA